MAENDQPVLTFRVTQRYAGGEAEGNIKLSTETAERKYPCTREQAEECARAHGARFEEQA